MPPRITKIHEISGREERDREISQKDQLGPRPILGEKSRGALSHPIQVSLTGEARSLKFMKKEKGFLGLQERAQKTLPLLSETGPDLRLIKKPNPNSPLKRVRKEEGIFKFFQKGIKQFFRWWFQPRGMVFMALPTGGGGSGGKDLFEIEREIQQEIRIALIQAARQFLQGNPPSQPLKIHLFIDFSTGKVMGPRSTEEISLSYKRIPFRIDLLNDRIHLVGTTRQNLKDLLDFQRHTNEEGWRIQGILNLDGKEVIKGEENTVEIGLSEAEKRELGKAPTLQQVDFSEVIVRPRATPRRAQTEPWYGGVDPVTPAPTHDSISANQYMLSQFAREAWQRIRYKDHPPLLRFINPPLMVGKMIVDTQGAVQGLFLRRPDFSGYREIYPPPDMGQIPQGTHVSSLITKDGTLIKFSPLSPLTPLAEKALNQLLNHPKNELQRQSFFQENPYYEGLLYSQGPGNFLFNLNSELAKGDRGNDKFVIRAYLVQMGKNFIWEALTKPNQQPAQGTVAIVDLGLQIRPILKGYQGSEFHYRIHRGKIPEEALDLIHWVKQRVKNYSANQ